MNHRSFKKLLSMKLGLSKNGLDFITNRLFVFNCCDEKIKINDFSNTKFEFYSKSVNWYNVQRYAYLER